MCSRPSLRRLFPLLPATLLPGCVAYTPDPVTAVEIAAETGRRVGGPLSLTEAVAIASVQNPELRALSANARAALAATSVPTSLQAQFNGGQQQLSLMFDPAALLWLLQRGAAANTAEARAAAALAELETARWRTTARIAEAFAVDRALAACTVPDTTLDVAAYEAAGLAAPVLADQLRAAQARAAGERATLAQQQQDNLEALRRLLGLPRHAAVSCRAFEPSLLQEPPATDAALLQRPDLALAVARFRVADAEFRQAVAEQWPTLQLGPMFELKTGMLDVMSVLTAPIEAPAQARAARERREAARANLEAAWLDAAADAANSTRQRAAARAQVDSFAAMLAAAATRLEAARTRLDVEPDAFAAFSEAAQMAVREAMDLRAAAIIAARAEVRCLEARGWPVWREPGGRPQPTGASQEDGR